MLKLLNIVSSHQGQLTEQGPWHCHRNLCRSPEEQRRLLPDALSAHFHHALLRALRARGRARVDQLAHVDGLFKRLSLFESNKR